MKALWTLYTIITYLLYTLVIALVLGPQRWNGLHYAGLAGAPFVIYAVRSGITMFFDWRISQKQAQVEALQKQRDAKIEDLKKATRYDSTQELLQKYGGAEKPTPPKSHQQTQQGTKRKITPTGEPQRTGLPPPPTANIPRRTTGSAAPAPQQPNVDTNFPTNPGAKSPLSAPPLMDSPAAFTPDEPGFAPNAFSNPPQQARPAYEQPPKWYDRILDVLLGEDETLAKNRIVLICSNCRLVNGQAPPGVKSLEEIGKWKCGGCGDWNGVQNEAAHVVETKRKAEEEQVDREELVGKGNKEAAKHSRGLDARADLDALEEASKMQNHAREIPESEEDAPEEDRSEGDGNDGDDDTTSNRRRRTRSANKQNAKKRR